MSVFRRVLLTYLALSVATLAVLGVALDRVLERRATQSLEHQLEAEARAVGAAIAGSDAPQPLVRSMGEASGTRLTVIRADGVVLADSEHDPATMENHATRPEVRAALAGRIGVATRTSATVRRPFLYLALQQANGLVVRAALPAGEVAAQRAAARALILAALGIVATLAAIASVVIARSVARPLAVIGDQVAAVAAGRFAHLDPAGPRETRALTDAVNHMASELASRVDELRAETRLREEILASMEDGLLLATPGGGEIYSNPACERLLGPGAAATIERLLPDGGATEVAVRHPVRRDVRLASLRLEDGRRLVVASDVTEERRLEAMRRDFVADASHELKTPIAAILATAETIEAAAGEDPVRVKGFATTLSHEARRLGRLVEDLLDLARLERAEEQLEPVPLSEVARIDADRARAAATAKGLDFEASIAPDVVVEGSRRDLSLAIGNLLDNAVRYTASGRVGLRLTATRRTATIEVSDTGTGISSKDLPRIFERFYRVDEARARDTGGTGLGLAIVKHVAETHAGRVTARSELGLGSTFSLEIPLVR